MYFFSDHLELCGGIENIIYQAGVSLFKSKLLEFITFIALFALLYIFANAEDTHLNIADPLWAQAQSKDNPVQPSLEVDKESSTKSTEQQVPFRVKSFYACLVSFSANELVLVKYSPHRIPGSKEIFSCNQFDESSIIEVLMSVYGAILNPLLVDVNLTTQNSKDGVVFKYDCHERGLKGIFAKPCPKEFVQAVNEDKTAFFDLINSIKIPNPKRQLTVKDEYMDFKDKALIDPVAQILNKSAGCPELGCQESFWYAYNPQRCIYRKAVINNTIFSPSITELNLFEFNPNQIKINLGSLTMAGNLTSTTTIKFKNRTIFFVMTQLDVDQLAKDWAMIYTNYCKVPKETN